MSNTLTVEVEEVEDGLFLRQELATAENDEFTVEVAANTNGSVLLTYSEKQNPNKWKTFVLSPHALVDATLAKIREK